MCGRVRASSPFYGLTGKGLIVEKSNVLLSILRVCDRY
jgi:hypothetical protein